MTTAIGDDGKFIYIYIGRQEITYINKYIFTMYTTHENRTTLNLWSYYRQHNYTRVFMEGLDFSDVKVSFNNFILLHVSDRLQ